MNNLQSFVSDIFSSHRQLLERKRSRSTRNKVNPYCKALQDADEKCAYKVHQKMGHHNVKNTLLSFKKTPCTLSEYWPPIPGFKLTWNLWIQFNRIARDQSKANYGPNWFLTMISWNHLSCVPRLRSPLIQACGPSILAVWFSKPTKVTVTVIRKKSKIASQVGSMSILEIQGIERGVHCKKIGIRICWYSSWKLECWPIYWIMEWMW